jgi:hypothetical protein
MTTPTNTRTQALIQEAGQPCMCSKDEILALFESAVPVLAAAAQQGSELASKARLAKLSEENEIVAGRIQPYLETAGAIQRLCLEAEQALERLAMAFAQLDRYHGQFMPLAEEAGYSPAQELVADG